MDNAPCHRAARANSSHHVMRYLQASNADSGRKHVLKSCLKLEMVSEE